LNQADIVNRTCPFLGLEDDAGTAQAFPSIWNCCHRCLPSAPPNLKHQREYCLGGNYRACPVYFRPYAEPLPAHLRASVSPANRPQYIPWGKLAVVLSVVVALFTLGWGVLNQRTLSVDGGKEAGTAFDPGMSTRISASQPAAKVSSTPTVKSPTEPPAPLASFTIAAPRAITHTPTFAPPSTRAVAAAGHASKHQLDVPIGTDLKFVIHKVLDGENFELYESRYGTSREAIIALSPNKEVPVWVDSLVVIPVGFTDAAGLPVFVVYQVKEEERGISTEELAKRLGVDLKDFKYYNGMVENGDRPLVGDYFLVPRPSPVP